MEAAVYCRKLAKKNPINSAPCVSSGAPKLAPQTTNEATTRLLEAVGFPAGRLNIKRFANA
jgi:hypothetical protein